MSTLSSVNFCDQFLPSLNKNKKGKGSTLKTAKETATGSVVHSSSRRVVGYWSLFTV